MRYRRKIWDIVYTDGSVTTVIQDSGAGIAISLPNGSTKAASAATRRLQQLQSKFRGIGDGHLSCCGLTTEEHHVCSSHWCTFISTSTDQQRIAHLALQLLSNNCRVAFQWIPTQPGNELADTIAKQGAQIEQPGAYVSYQEKAMITKTQVIMVRLRT